MNIPVIYEDDWLLVADKPSGLLTVPTPKKEKRTLTSILNDELQKKGLLYRLHPCHRLDRETSGLIVYAKGKSVQQKMFQLFKEKKVKKTYVAFTQGQLPHTQGEITTPLDGLTAVTKYRVMAQERDFCVVEVIPLTGRTNQIRLHFKSIGHPLVGESKFAFRKDYLLKAKRTCLHAKRLDFFHPINNKHINLESALAQDLKDFILRHN